MKTRHVKLAAEVRFLGREVWLVIGLGALLASSVDAQYTANFQTNIISGVVSNWTGDYTVGNANYPDVLLIQNGGLLVSTGNGTVGNAVGGSNNTAIVTDTGSVWTNQGQLSVGTSGRDSSLIVSNGGVVWAGTTGLGFNGSSSNNTIVVTGSGSFLRGPGLTVGYGGSANRLVVSDGGTIIGGAAEVSGTTASHSNTVLVTDPGSTWYADVMMGAYGPANTMVISNGGAVFGGHGYIGYQGSLSPTANSNLVVVTGTGFGLEQHSGLVRGLSGRQQPPRD